ncbi:MAG: TRAP transporter small permease [Paracoccaceae bacterium]|nr:TRAP transporter small permease [Paracoccaceae bacterium]
MAVFGHLDRALGAVLRLACILLLSALFLLITENILRRGIGISGRPWFDEVIELCFAWLVMLGAAAIWRERGHFVVDLLGSGRVSAGLRTLAALIALAVVATLAARGYSLAVRAGATSPVLGAPRAIWYACLPVGGGLMSVYALRDVIATLRGTAK